MPTGTLSKMKTTWQTPVEYALDFESGTVSLNQYIGRAVRLTHTGLITCQNCHQKTKKSYQQGYCFMCMQRLAACDICMVKPEKCHFHLGTCREPQWGEQHCFIDHVIYLSKTSDLKVGITRHYHMMTRWIDQGATEAVIVAKVNTRRVAGLLEIMLAETLSDKTNWRKMLKNESTPVDWPVVKKQAQQMITAQIDALKQTVPGAIISLDASDKVFNIQYPWQGTLNKISSFNFDKHPEVSGTLLGIKGQYLIFDTGVLNVRKYSGYHVHLEEMSV